MKIAFFAVVVVVLPAILLTTLTDSAGDKPEATTLPINPLLKPDDRPPLQPYLSLNRNRQKDLSQMVDLNEIEDVPVAPTPIALESRAWKAYNCEFTIPGHWRKIAEDEQPFGSVAHWKFQERADATLYFLPASFHHEIYSYLHGILAHLMDYEFSGRIGKGSF